MKKVDYILKELRDIRGITTCSSVVDYTTTIEKYRKLLSLARHALNSNKALVKELEHKSRWNNRHLCGYEFTKGMRMDLRKTIRFQKNNIAALDKVFQKWCNTAYEYLERDDIRQKRGL